MKEQSSPAKVAIPYGIAFGVIMLLEFVISYTMGLNAADDPWMGIVVGVLNYLVLPILFIMLACNVYKNKINGGFISFGQCIKIGVSVGAIAGLVFSAISAIVYMAAPEIKQDILDQTKEALAASPGMTADAMKMTMSVTETFMQPYISIPVSTLIYAIVGFVMSLIVGAIVKKENPAGGY